MQVVLLAEIISMDKDVRSYGTDALGFDYVTFHVIEKQVISKFRRIFINELKWKVQWDVPIGQGEKFKSYLHVGNLVMLRGMIVRNQFGLMVNVSYWDPPAIDRLGPAKGHAAWPQHAIERLASGARVIHQPYHDSSTPEGARTRADVARGIPIVIRQDDWEHWDHEEE